MPVDIAQKFVEPALESYAVKVDDLWNEALAVQQKEYDDCVAYVNEFGAVYRAAHDAYVQFAACAHSLTVMIMPYNFEKMPSALFVDKGLLINQDPHGVHYKTDRGLGWEVRAYEMKDEARKPRSFIGTLDYWAAALVDPEFKQLCRKAARASDLFRGSRFSSRLGMMDMLDGETEAPQVRLGFREWLIGWRHSSIHDLRNREYVYYGAVKRVRAELAQRFEALMQDPVKAKACGAALDYFHRACFTKRVCAGAEQRQMKKLLEKEPVSAMPAGDHDQYLRKLAYIQMLGDDEIEVRIGDNLTSAIGNILCRGTYDDGFPAPLFNDHDYPLVQERVEQILSDAGVVMQQAMLQLDLSAVSDEELSSFVRYRTGEIDKYYSDIRFRESPEHLSEPVRAIMRRFNDEVRAKVASVAPKPGV